MFENRKEGKFWKLQLAAMSHHVLHQRVPTSRAFVVCHLITRIELTVMETEQKTPC
jgi:hypothetical protein